jgi:hypothetical protein
MRSEGANVVSINGGEPTLQKDLPSWLDHAREIGFKQRIIVTNGSQLSKPGYVKTLVDSGLTHINVSFHTCDEESFDLISGKRGAFEKADAGLRELLRVNPALESPLKIHVNLLLMEQTIGNAAKTVHYLADLGVPIVTLEWCRFKGGAAVEDNATILAYEVREALPAIKTALLAGKERGVHINHTDIAPCLFEKAEIIDLAGYINTREKDSHHVVTQGSRGRLNEHSHIKFGVCEECVLATWCSGFEKMALFGEQVIDPRATVDCPVSKGFSSQDILSHAEDQLKKDPSRVILQQVKDSLSLLAPPDVLSASAWSSLYAHHYGRLADLAHPSDDESFMTLGIFPAPRPSDLGFSNINELKPLLKRQAVIEKRLANIAESLSAESATERVGTNGDAGGALGSVAEAMFIGRAFQNNNHLWNPLFLSELRLFSKVEHALFDERSFLDGQFSTLDAVDKAVVDAFSNLHCVSLGPWVWILLKDGVGEGDSVVFDDYIIYVSSVLEFPRRVKLLQFVQDWCGWAFQRADRVSENGEKIIISDLGQEIVSLSKQVRWQPNIFYPSQDEVFL